MQLSWCGWIFQKNSIIAAWDCHFCLSIKKLCDEEEEEVSLSGAIMLVIGWRRILFSTRYHPLFGPGIPTRRVRLNFKLLGINYQISCCVRTPCQEIGANSEMPMNQSRLGGGHILLLWRCLMMMMMMMVWCDGGQNSGKKSSYYIIIILLLL